jgi:hypothetical protein
MHAMRYFITFLAFLLITQFAFSQSSNQAQIDKTKEEIKTLLQQLNQARIKHDRTALEQIYAKEFINVHSAGFIDDRTETINEIMTTDSIRPLPIPSLDELLVINDVAILKSIVGTTAGTVNANRLAGLYVYARRDGHWQIIHAQGTALQRERPAVKPDQSVLKTYAGKYERSPGGLIIVELVDDHLLINVVGRGIPKRKLMATSDMQFFDKLGTEYSFSKDEKQNLVLTTKLQGGQESRWTKINE